MKDVKSNKELQLEVVIKALSLLVQINVGKSLFFIDVKFVQIFAAEQTKQLKRFKQRNNI